VAARAEVQGRFRVPAEFLDVRRGLTLMHWRSLIYVGIFKLGDPMHKCKNGELAFVKTLGQYVVHPKAFRVAGRSSQARDLRQFVFSFSRLFQFSLELQRCRVFREPLRPALRPHKEYRHARRVRKELELDLSSFLRMPLVST